MPENGMRHGLFLVGTDNRPKEIVLGAGLEPACLSAYAPQTYVSAIPPPERECAKRTKFAVEVAPSQGGSGKLLLVSVLLLVLDLGGFSITSTSMSTSMSTSTTAEEWIKVDLHIHTLEDPKDVLDYSAHQLLGRAKALG